MIILLPKTGVSWVGPADRWGPVWTFFNCGDSNGRVYDCRVLRLLGNPGV